MTLGRLILLVAGAATLAAITADGAVARKPSRRPVAAKPVEISPLSLAANGLIIPGSIGQGPRNLPFGTQRVRAVALIAEQLGPPVKSGSYPDCGQGHGLDHVNFRSGIELTFLRGKFVGWTLDEGGDRRHRMVNGIGIGETVATLRKLIPDLSIDPGDEANGGLGPMFQSETWPNGWLDGVKPSSKIIAMYAGETCIVS